MEVNSFEDLEKWIAQLPNPQSDGTAGEICEQTGGKYTGLFESHLARLCDVAIAERETAKRMQRSIKDFIGESSGAIYWRKRVDYQVASWNEAAGWVRAAAYCRLAIAREKQNAA
jgi:hypothetical protein